MEHFRNKSLDNLQEIVDGIVYTEEWLPVSGFENSHHISNFGRLKAISRIYNGGRCKKEMIRLGSFCGRYISDTLKENGIKKSTSRHRLVAQAFIPNPFKLPEVNHLFGKKKDNRVHQLEWSTKSDNELHAHRIGLKKSKYGEDDECSTFTNAQVLDIFNSKLSPKELADKHNTTTKYISSIKTGRRWSKITGKKLEVKFVWPSKDSVLDIYNSPLLFRELAEIHKVSLATISCIKSGFHHSDITGKKYVAKGYSIVAE